MTAPVPVTIVVEDVNDHCITLRTPRGQQTLSWSLLRECATQSDYDLRAAYSALHEAAVEMLQWRHDREREQRESHRVAKQRDARIRACKRHRIAHRSEAYGFSAPVARHQNPAAHGGVMFIDTCKCGAERRTLVNGWHVERGEWT